MAAPTLPRPLRGIVPPMVTPLSDQDQLDLDGLEKLIEHLLNGGVHALFALGTTGEGPHLSYSVRHQVVERVCDQVAGRVPVLIGITDTAFDASLELAGIAYAAGAAGLVAAPPYYFPVSQPELTDYFTSLAEAVQLPLFLYNMPGCTKTAIQPETVATLSGVENIIGLKDSSRDLDYLQDVRQRIDHLAEFSLLVGPEELLASVVGMGVHGGVNGGANMFPDLYVALYEAAVAGDTSEVNRLHGLVMQIAGSIYTIGDWASRHVRGTKCALKCLEVCDDYVNLPFRRLEGEDRTTIARAVRDLLVMLGSQQQAGAFERT